MGMSELCLIGVMRYRHDVIALANSEIRYPGINRFLNLNDKHESFSVSGPGE